MSALIDVILPVFLVIAFGYGAARAKLFPDAAIDGLMRFGQNFALPGLLFLSMTRIDFSTAYDPGLLISFYAGAFAGFAAGFLGAVFLFKRPVTDAVAIGFVAMFSNSLLLGLPLTERAYGPEALTGNYAIISMHSPMFYAFGIALMEVARARGQDLSTPRLTLQILRTIFTQPLVAGITLGFLVNLADLPLPGVLISALDMTGKAGIPAALFGLGGVLTRYRTEGDRLTIAWICGCSLGLHPLVTWTLGTQVFALDTAALRSAVITAAMAPGVNAYIFAHYYGTARRVAASTVLVATGLTMLTGWFWLHFLP